MKVKVLLVLAFVVYTLGLFAQCVNPGNICPPANQQQ